MSELLKLLEGGDVRSIGQVNDVIRIVEAEPERFQEVFAGLQYPDKVVRLRAADVVEKLTRNNPALLNSYKEQILNFLNPNDFKTLKWSLAQLLARLELNETEVTKVIKTLIRYMQEPGQNKFVKVFCMQALVDISLKHTWFQAEARQIVLRELEFGSPAGKARARKLLKILG